MRNRHANEPLKLLTAANEVAAIPQKTAHPVKTLAIRVRFPSKAKGTTVMSVTARDEVGRGRLTERGVTDIVESVE
jgi:hypothetical protein